MQARERSRKITPPTAEVEGGRRNALLHCQVGTRWDTDSGGGVGAGGGDEVKEGRRSSGQSVSE